MGTCIMAQPHPNTTPDRSHPSARMSRGLTDYMASANSESIEANELLGLIEATVKTTESSATHLSDDSHQQQDRNNTPRIWTLLGP